jgi:hypothetical protein
MPQATKAIEVGELGAIEHDIARATRDGNLDALNTIEQGAKGSVYLSKEAQRLLEQRFATIRPVVETEATAKNYLTQALQTTQNTALTNNQVMQDAANAIPGFNDYLDISNGFVIPKDPPAGADEATIKTFREQQQQVQGTFNKSVDGKTGVADITPLLLKFRQEQSAKGWSPSRIAELEKRLTSEFNTMVQLPESAKGYLQSEEARIDQEVSLKKQALAERHGVSKQFTQAGIKAAMDKGKVGLDDVFKVIPEGTDNKYWISSLEGKDAIRTIVENAYTVDNVDPAVLKEALGAALESHWLTGEAGANEDTLKNLITNINAQASRINVMQSAKDTAYEDIKAYYTDLRAAETEASLRKSSAQARIRGGLGLPNPNMSALATWNRAIGNAVGSSNTANNGSVNIGKPLQGNNINVDLNDKAALNRIWNAKLWTENAQGDPKKDTGAGLGLAMVTPTTAIAPANLGMNLFEFAKSRGYREDQIPNISNDRKNVSANREKAKQFMLDNPSITEQFGRLYFEGHLKANNGNLEKAVKAYYGHSNPTELNKHWNRFLEHYNNDRSRKTPYEIRQAK